MVAEWIMKSECKSIQTRLTPVQCRLDPTTTTEFVSHRFPKLFFLDQA